MSPGREAPRACLLFVHTQMSSVSNLEVASGTKYGCSNLYYRKLESQRFLVRTRTTPSLSSSGAARCALQCSSLSPLYLWPPVSPLPDNHPEHEKFSFRVHFQLKSRIVGPKAQTRKTNMASLTVEGDFPFCFPFFPISFRKAKAPKDAPGPSAMICCQQLPAE